ncbi:hypothetical protein BDV93DRAFT_260149 [Ceratobasidium sp. AG-I]|nr:hypothetical protein BDV93DRAFT_260149 [Ceratobasidium sp. AG-I]
MPSICEISSDNCAAVYQCWKSARDTLSQSIGIYLKACDALAYLSIESLTQTIINSGCSL